MRKNTAKKILTDAGIQRLWWPREIIKAENQGFMDVEVEKKASNWTTCACGREDKSLKMGWDWGMGEYDHAPKDPSLYTWGSLFPFALRDEDWPKAAKLVIKIHNRAIKLLEEMSDES